MLLDTQTFLLMANAETMNSVPPRVHELLTDLENELVLSSISVSEIALKQSLGKLDFSREEVRQTIRAMSLAVLPFTTEHAMQLYDLPLHHKDPFDRHIIATALSEGIPLIGGDWQFRQYAGLQVIW